MPIFLPNWNLQLKVIRTRKDIGYDPWASNQKVPTIIFFLFSFDSLLFYYQRPPNFFSRCFSIANRQNEGKSKKKKICFELHPRATLFNCLSATLQWGHSRNYCPAKRMFICLKTAQARRDRERQFWEKKFSVANFSTFFRYFLFLRKCKWSESTIHIRILQQLNWFAKLYMYSWQHCKRRKKEKPKNLNEMLHRS